MVSVLRSGLSCDHSINLCPKLERVNSRLGLVRDLGQFSARPSVSSLHFTMRSGV